MFLWLVCWFQIRGGWKMSNHIWINVLVTFLLDLFPLIVPLLHGSISSFFSFLSEICFVTSKNRLNAPFCLQSVLYPSMFLGDSVLWWIPVLVEAPPALWWWPCPVLCSALSVWMEQCASTASLLASVREQERQFEMLSRALEEERRSCAGTLPRPLPNMQVKPSYPRPYHLHPPFSTQMPLGFPLDPSDFILSHLHVHASIPSLWPDWMAADHTGGKTYLLWWL